MISNHNHGQDHLKPWPCFFMAALPLFIDMVLIENIVDELECCAREGEEPDWEDIEDAAECLIRRIPYAGIGQE